MAIPITIQPATGPALEDRLRRAQEAFREYYIRCFWSVPEDFIVTEDTLPLVIEGLKMDGGHKGWRLAHELCR